MSLQRSTIWALVLVTWLVAAAVHFHQTDALPGSPAWSGSPGSLSASTLVPLTWVVPVALGITVALAKSLFAAGRGLSASLIDMDELAPRP